MKPNFPAVTGPLCWILHFARSTQWLLINSNQSIACMADVGVWTRMGNGERGMEESVFVVLDKEGISSWCCCCVQNARWPPCGARGTITVGIRPLSGWEPGWDVYSALVESWGGIYGCLKMESWIQTTDTSSGPWWCLCATILLLYWYHFLLCLNYILILYLLIRLFIIVSIF